MWSRLSRDGHVTAWWPNHLTCCDAITWSLGLNWTAWQSCDYLVTCLTTWSHDCDAFSSWNESRDIRAIACPLRDRESRLRGYHVIAWPPLDCIIRSRDYHVISWLDHVTTTYWLDHMIGVLLAAILRLSMNQVRESQMWMATNGLCLCTFDRMPTFGTSFLENLTTLWFSTAWRFFSSFRPKSSTFFLVRRNAFGKKSVLFFVVWKFAGFWIGHIGANFHYLTHTHSSHWIVIKHLHDVRFFSRNMVSCLHVPQYINHYHYQPVWIGRLKSIICGSFLSDIIRKKSSATEPSIKLPYS